MKIDKTEKDWKYWEILQGAKKYLVGPDLERTKYKGKNKCAYICNSVLVFGNDNPPSLDKCYEVIHLINNRLRGKPTLEAWLVDKAGVHSKELKGEIGEQRMQKHRHDWVDLLIKEFKLKGI